MNQPLLTSLVLSLVLLRSIAHASETEGWTDLFDPDLSQWELWMGVPHESVKDLPPGTPVSPDGKTGTPLGLNNDPKQVFSVIEQEGEIVLKITGEIYGGLTTLAEYENYHVRLETKWGQKIWEPRLTRLRDNGLLFHCVGPHGSFWNVWKRCLEVQIEQTNFGDLYCLAGTSAQVTIVPRDKGWAFDPKGELKITGARPGSAAPMVKRSADYEREGEWNTVELYTVGDRAVFLSNGHVVNALRDTQVKIDNVSRPLTRGKLQLQSEAAEVYFRRMQIRPIKEIPAPILQAAGLIKR